MSIRNGRRYNFNRYRVMASIEAGENVVCINLVKEDIEQYKGYYRKA